MNFFDQNRWTQELPALQKIYQQALPFPHHVFDNFLDAKLLDHAAQSFPPLQGADWIHYQHVNENKGGLNKRHVLPPDLLAVIDELNRPAFVAWLCKLTGIEGLKPDPSLEGGGLHQIKRGGFLNIHADFTVHPHQRMWRRRVNVLIYLNQDWADDYGGHLELWNKDMSSCAVHIAPIFNRCVIFNTDADSFHGHPHPLTCPDNRTRKSIALYYFTEESQAPRKIATNYRARPGDGLKAVAIYLDKKLLAFYNIVKGVLGIDDRFVSHILKFLSRDRNKKP